MGGHKSVQQMTMNIGPMFVFLRMYLIAVCLDVRRSAAARRRRGPRASESDPPCTRLRLSPPVQLHHHVFSRLEDTVRYAHAIVDEETTDYRVVD